MKVKVCGWTSHQNIGDESYKLSFPQLFPDHTFTFGDSINYQDSADAIILGGGDIFNEVYVNKVLKDSAKRKLAISVSANKNTPVHLLERFDQIFVRDAKSVDYLAKAGINSTYMPDVSTCLSGDKAAGKQYIQETFKKEGLDLYQKVIGVVFNAHLCSGKSDMYARDFVTFNYVLSQLGRVADETSASFVFFPMSTGMPYDDRVTNSYLSNRCKFWKKNLVIFDRFSVQETINLIAGCDAVISSRLHTSIFSLTSGVPFVDLTHHDKNKGFLETSGLEDWSVSYWNFDVEKMKSLLGEMLNKEASKLHIQTIHQRQLELLKRESNNVCFL